MRRLRLLQLLTCLAVWTRLCNGAANRTCLCKDVENLQGLYTDRPCNECASGHYRTCDRGSYYAHHPTMCIYASRQDYTHDEARLMCAKRDVAGFPAFVGSLEESYDISHYVWNMLKNGVEGNETYFWLGGKFKRYERTGQKFWLFEYRGYHDEVPRELLPDNATLEQAISEGRTCLAGHTEHHTKLYPRHCDEKLPAVCYNYRQTAKHFCEQVDGKVWTLFQGQCYYVYSAPTANKTLSYKTYFDAQVECAAMGSVLATVTDDATFNRTMDLATGRETLLDIDDGTWIGLQVGGRTQDYTGQVPGLYYYADGTVQNFTTMPRCTWWNGTAHVPCRFSGRWDDGTPYDEAALVRFWATYPGYPNDNWWPVHNVTDGEKWQPNLEPIKDYFKYNKSHPDPLKPWGCGYWKIPAVYRDRCDKDKFQHCTQIFPGGTEAMQKENAGCDGCEAYGHKWNDRWCYYLQRGYICQREADSETDPYRLNDEL